MERVHQSKNSVESRRTRLSRFPIIVFQKASEALLAPNFTFEWKKLRRQQLVLHPLVIPASRNAWWAEHNLYPRSLQDLAEAFAVLRVPVDDQLGLSTSTAIPFVGQLPGYLPHPLAIG